MYYYAAMLADVLLRISWAINILLAQMKDSAAVVTASAILAPLEVLRLDLLYSKALKMYRFLKLLRQILPLQ